MADVYVPQANKVTTIGATNRYILKDADSGRASQFAIQMDTNAGTFTYTFHAKLPTHTVWQAAQAYAVSAPGTAASGGTTAEIWMIDASGKDISVNVTASTGSPTLTFMPVVG